ncbi:MAG: hypothetical protein JSV56_03720, partial [Methanomassiliicoccales archaeon]
PYYHYLMASEVQNFNCYITTQNYINFMKEKGDTVNTYPLKFIWTRSGKIYYVLQPFPGMENDTERPKILEKIQLLKNQFHGFYLDWLNYLIISPLDDIPAGTEAVFKGDSVFVSYATAEDGIQTTVRKWFLPSGRLISFEVETQSQKVVSYPDYQEVDGKWLCIGWDTQIFEDNEVNSGLSTKLELQKTQNAWFPARVEVLVQTIEKPDERYISTLYLKSYDFNLPLLELPNQQQQDSILQKDS